MQHSTHNHTPTHCDHHHPDKQSVRRSRPGARRNTPNRMSPQDPTVCRTPNRNPENHESDSMFHPATPAPPRRSNTSMESRKRRTSPTEADAGQPHHSVRLLRKEVIQPHLPVRLPCYDFVPIAGPTFDDSLPQGVRPSASGVTNFHDVTGGVYKARERIHRSVADLRLLATPTSRGRVADPDPN
jgi:hypothetical protein